MQQIDASVPFKLIYSLGKHPYLGYIIEPHIVQLNANGSLSLASKRVFSTTVKEFMHGIDEIDLKIIAILDELEQTNIIKKYHKKAIRPMDYFSQVFDDKIYAFIRPKIENRLIKILELIKSRPLYLMSKKDGYPAEQELSIATEATSVLFHFRRTAEETRYFPTLKYDGQRMEFMFKGAEIIIQEQAWLLLENTLYHFDQPLDGKKLSPFLNKRYISVAKATEKKYFETFVTGLIEKHHVYAEGFDIHTIREDATPILTIHYTEGQQSYASLSFRYGEYLFSPSTEQKITVRVKHDEEQDSYSFTRIKRALVWEEKQKDLLLSLGLEEEGAFFGTFVPSGKFQNSSLSMLTWAGAHRATLEDLGFVLQQKKGNKQFFIGETTLNVEVQEENDWFDVRAYVQFGPYRIPFIQLRSHILNRTAEFTLPNGEIAIIPETWFSQYEHLFQFSSTKDELRLNKLHVGLLHEISELTEVTFHRKLKGLASFEEIEHITTPKFFNGELRPYQQAGYNWFHFLRKYRFGGILADDMGLGKTVQTLALLQSQKENYTESDHARVSLLILPTSLIYNWQQEAKRFTPKMRIYLHTGSNRIKNPIAFTSFDLIITTYGIARSDESLLSSFFFDYIILDESQNIKNATSKSFKAIKGLKGKNKLALSGTPIENSVSDIWSQMHFANPALLGSYNYFQKEFVLPIEKKKDEEKALRLQGIIKPFILRRTKNQVATELPPKTEQVIYCTMGEEQLRLYEKTKSEYRNFLLEETGQLNNTSFTLLQGLTKLRQLANHPSMTEEDYTESSGKFDAVIDMLDSVYTEGNKVLIFSQFVKHLQIFKGYFDKKQIKYAYLDGSTKERAEVVNAFKKKDDIKVFLISIKAGGVGLNLTEADYVFILDPWWNPAVEQQAIDRTHRIGQLRNVFIYRFITKDSVEEKIVQLQTRKKSFASSLITTEESFVKSLSKDDLRVLLE